MYYWFGGERYRTIISELMQINHRIMQYLHSFTRTKCFINMMHNVTDTRLCWYSKLPCQGHCDRLGPSDCLVVVMWRDGSTAVHWDTRHYSTPHYIPPAQHSLNNWAVAIMDYMYQNVSFKGRKGIFRNWQFHIYHQDNFYPNNITPRINQSKFRQCPCGSVGHFISFLAVNLFSRP